RCLPFHGCVEGKQYLLNRIVCARDQASDVELIGADAIERREVSPEHMILPIHHAGALKRPQIADLLHHYDQRLVAPRTLTDRAGINGVEMAAVLALDDLG